MRALSVTALLVLTTISSAAPALGDKPRWEYAELSYRNLPGRPAGVDADGNEIPAVPATVSLKWISGAGELEAKGWTDLAEKLKVTGLKKDTSLAFQKIQLLNYLGSEGWELMEQTANSTVQMVDRGGFGGGPGGGGRGGFTTSSLSTNTWMLKRRVP